MLERVGAKDMLLGGSIIAAPLLVLATLGSVFLSPELIGLGTLMGCYVANGSPSLKVEPGLIHIGEPERRTFSYVAEPFKEGYHFAVRPALSLRPMGRDRYAFVRDQRGIGYFWPLLTTRSDDPGSLRQPKDFGGRFRIIASDGTAIVYTRTTAQHACR